MRAAHRAVAGGSVWTGVGGSMLPTILPGSRLHLAPRERTDVHVAEGDVVCFLDGSRRFVSHRVVAIVREGGERRLMISGDRSACPEAIDEAAIVGVVTRVEHPLLSYGTHGAIGSWISRSAVRRTVPFRGALLATSVFWQIYSMGLRIGRRLLPSRGSAS
jgi:hypothetical protein